MRRFVALLIVAALFVGLMPAISEANRGFRWEVLSGDPRGLGRVENKTQAMAWFRSAAGFNDMRRLGFSLAEIRMIQAALIENGVGTLVIRPGHVFPGGLTFSKEGRVEKGPTFVAWANARFATGYFPLGLTGRVPVVVGGPAQRKDGSRLLGCANMTFLFVPRPAERPKPKPPVARPPAPRVPPAPPVVPPAPPVVQVPIGMIKFVPDGKGGWMFRSGVRLTAEGAGRSHSVFSTSGPNLVPLQVVPGRYTFSEETPDMMILLGVGLIDIQTGRLTRFVQLASDQFLAAYAGKRNIFQGVTVERGHQATFDITGPTMVAFFNVPAPVLFAPERERPEIPPTIRVKVGGVEAGAPAWEIQPPTSGGQPVQGPTKASPGRADEPKEPPSSGGDTSSPTVPSDPNNPNQP